MATITIWHNPACSTSRKVLAALCDAGREPRVVEYLKTPPSAEDIRAVVAMTRQPASALLRGKEPAARDAGLTAPGVSEERLIAAMAADPVLIERPVVILDNRAVLCRPAEKVAEILG